MLTIEQITLPNGDTCDIVDQGARTLIDGLGDLAHKDSATGTYQPEGTVSAPAITVTPAIETVTAPTFSATVENNVLTLSFNPGAVPSTIVTGITSATASAPTFTGTLKTVTVS